MSDIEDIEMLKTTIVEGLTREGCPPVVAELAAQRVIVQLRAAHGGTNIYIASSKQQRDQQILQTWRDSDGTKESYQRIAKQYDVHPRTVYRVINRAQNKAKAKPAVKPAAKQQASQSSGDFGSDEWCL